MYAYAANNPVRYTEPTGKWILTITINATATAGAEGSADNVSDVMKEIGFKHVLTPGGLERQLQNSDKVTEIKVYKNETD